jgi:hypothetical protein
MAHVVLGKQPVLLGRVLDAARVQGFITAGELVPGACVLYLNVASEWHRLVIDHGTVHWHQENSEPKTWFVREQAWEYPISDLERADQVIGSPISAFDITGDDDNLMVRLSFSNGRKLFYTAQGDINAVHVA